MGTWGVAIFSDDLAADLREDFKNLIGDGLTATQAVDKLLIEYQSSLEDQDEQPVFWIALAATQWSLGRLEERTKREALEIIESRRDLERWDPPATKSKRAIVLEKLRGELLSQPPEPKRVPRRIKEANDWDIGEMIAFQLNSGRWTLMRVIGHHEDKGGRSAICEIIDWIGDTAFPDEDVTSRPVRCSEQDGSTSQFLFQEPRTKKDQSRIRRLHVKSVPSQTVGGFMAFVWPHVDHLMNEVFNLR